MINENIFNSMYKQIIVAASLAIQHANAVKCNALVLSGGSNNGAWEIGVMWGLANYGNTEDYYWDVVSGISAGAINTAGTAGFAPEEVLWMTQYLSDAWLDQTNDQVYIQRPGSLIDIAFREPSFLDDSPGLDHIRDIMSYTNDFARRVSVAAVDVGTGEFVVFDQENTSYYDFA